MPNITFPFSLTRVWDAHDFGVNFRVKKCDLYSNIYGSEHVWILVSLNIHLG